jgi:competence ComEA-like helix-hairpin-helix protein
MSPFRPADIRLMIVLSALAVLGSVIFLLQRNEKASRFKLDFLADKGGYRYAYSTSQIQSFGRDTVLDSSRVLTPKFLADSTEKIDLNRCGYYDLEALPGIGPALAERIIAFRDSLGPFQSADELLEVKGIGPVKLALIKDRIVVR